MKVRFRFILNVTFFLLSKIIVEGKRIGVITKTLEVQYAKEKRKKEYTILWVRIGTYINAQ